MKLLHTRQETIQKTQRLFFDIKDGVYIVGRNKYGISVVNLLTLHGINFIGFLDDFSDLSEYSGCKVFKSSEIVNPKVIINCVIEGRTWNVQCWIESLGANLCPNYFSLQLAFPEQLAPIDFLSSSDFELIDQELDALSEIYYRLYDKQSKTEFEHVLNFRYNRDINFMKDFSLRLEDQYFESFIQMEDHPVFVDGGGFNGQTSVAFSKRYPDYAAIHYFEPSPEFFEVSKAVLQPLSGIHFYNAGLWNVEGNLHFNASLSSASRFEENGLMRVATTTIDQSIKERVSFIKLDIEGAEKQAIEGAENIIRKYKPALAICVYHKQEDFFKIPFMLQNLRPDYKIFFRHYTQGVFESVMYFI